MHRSLSTAAASCRPKRQQTKSVTTTREVAGDVISAGQYEHFCINSKQDGRGVPVLGNGWCAGRVTEGDTARAKLVSRVLLKYSASLCTEVTKVTKLTKMTKVTKMTTGEQSLAEAPPTGSVGSSV